MKKVSEQEKDLPAQFLIDHISPILNKIGIFRSRNEKHYRWVNHKELSAMVVQVTKATVVKKTPNVHVHAEPETHVHEEQDVQMDVQEANVHVQTGVVGKLNNWINARNEKALSKREQKRLEEAKFDPWKRVLPDGSIEDIVYEPTEEEKELARKKQILEEKMKIQADILQLESTDYLTTYAKKEAEHNLKIQREAQKTQQQMVALTLEKSKARNESFQATKDALFNLVKLGTIFGVAILLIVIANNLIGGSDDVASDFPSAAVQTEETFPW